MSTIMSIRTLCDGPCDNDCQIIISDTYGLKPRDRAIRSKKIRTLRHQQQGQSPDGPGGPRKYFEMGSAENKQFSYKYSDHFKSQTAQSSVGQCNKGHEKAVSSTHILQHQEFAIRAEEHILRARKHNRQLVSVAITAAKSSAILTS
jgi:hypothetical protein